MFPNTMKSLRLFKQFMTFKLEKICFFLTKGIFFFFYFEQFLWIIKELVFFPTQSIQMIKSLIEFRKS